MDALNRVRVASQRANAWISRHRVVVLAAMTLWFFTLFFLRARGKPLWHDEVYTALMARFPVATLWRANLDGVDLSPPLYTLITHVLQTAVAGPDVIVTRLAAMVGFLTAAVLLFLTVSRRTNAMLGILSVLVLCATPAWDYAVEARGYGLSLAFFALALYAWTEAAADRRATLHWTVMALALTAEVWTHYYAALAFLPIVIGEIVRQTRLRRFQDAAWLALTCAGLGVLPVWKLITVAAAHRHTFWAQTGDQTIGSAYAYVLKDLPTHTVLISVIGLLIAYGLLRRARHRDSSQRLAPHDLAAALGCLAIPAAGLMLGHATHVFTARYLVFADVGMAFAIPLLLWWLMPDHGLGEMLAVLTLAWPVFSSTIANIREPPSFSNQLEGHPILSDWVLRGKEPIVLTGGVDYLGLWYSFPEAARPLALYLADPASQLRAEGTDTLDRGYLALARWTPLPAVPVETFTRTHRHFWLYSTGRDWVLDRLRGMEASLVERARESGDNGTLYEVSLPER